MIGSYIKTSSRSIVRNKLFSTINIIGLAVSMSVGLLMIGIMTDLTSYDMFHEKRDRIFRVNSTTKFFNGNSVDLASTSVMAGKRIKETIAAVEDITLMQRQFSGDAKINDDVIPVAGLWADDSFFKVFTFPLLQGNPATALKDPYSIVLTEKAAIKLFGNVDAIGKSMKFDTTNYVVTGVAKNIPQLSHMNFEVLISFSSIDLQSVSSDGHALDWGNIYSNYVYLVLPNKENAADIQASLDKLCAAENKKGRNSEIILSLQPLSGIVLGPNLHNQIGPTSGSIIMWIFSGLAVVVIISACFNYTNLSIARSLRRTREVGIRKVIGALKSHVLSQFISEAVIISLMALVLSVFVFLFLRSQFLSIDPYFAQLVSLAITPKLIGYFILMAIVVGLIAGILPAIFFSNVNAIQVLKDVSTFKLFRHVTLRKSLIVAQYVFSLMFITATVIGYNQYKGFISMDLGFSTENILNIKLQGNKSVELVKEFLHCPQ